MKANQWLIHCAPRWRRWTCPVARTNQLWEHPDSSSAVPEPESGWNAPPALLSLTERSKQLMNKQLIVLGSPAASSRTADEQVALETTGRNSLNQSSPGTGPAAEGLSPEKHSQRVAGGAARAAASPEPGRGIPPGAPEAADAALLTVHHRVGSHPQHAPRT